MTIDIEIYAQMNMQEGIEEHHEISPGKKKKKNHEEQTE